MNLNEAALKRLIDAEAQDSHLIGCSILDQENDDYPSAKEDVELLQSALQFFKDGSIYVKLLKNDYDDANEICEVHITYGKGSHSIDPAYADRIGEFALRAAEEAGMKCESQNHYLEMTISNNGGLSIEIQKYRQVIEEIERPKMGF